MTAALALAGTACANERSPEPESSMSRVPPAASSTQPVLFVGHGSPMNAIEDNEWSRAFRALGRTLARPKAILSVSAHWFVRGSFVTAQARPETIHDFGGFPQALFDMEYPASGAPELARRVCALGGEDVVRASDDWGLDHGTWTVLCHLFPAADVPVVQLSLDGSLTAAEHLRLAQRLAPLAGEGVLVLGSGNLVHNLRDAFGRMHSGDESVPEWAASFDRELAQACLQKDLGFVTRALESADGRVAHPTPEHYLPVVYALGAAREGAEVTFPIEGFDHSLSMRAVRFG